MQGPPHTYCWQFQVGHSPTLRSPYFSTLIQSTSSTQEVDGSQSLQAGPSLFLFSTLSASWPGSGPTHSGGATAPCITQLAHASVTFHTFRTCCTKHIL